MPESTANRRDLCEIEFRKRPAHFEIFLKSSELEEFFRSLTSNARQSVALGSSFQGPTEIYALSATQMNQFKDLSLGTVNAYGSTDLFIGGKVNLSFFRAVGLGGSSGLTFRLNLPLSPRAVKEFWDKFNEAACEFYDTFMVPENVRAEFVAYEQRTTPSRL